MMRPASLLLALLWGGVATAAPLQMQDFAYGIPLQVDGDGAIYSLAVPEQVYRHTLNRDLGDLRVFNGNGEVVPHLLQREPLEQPLAARRIEAKLYPLPTQENHPDNEELHIAIDREGTLIDFYAGNLPLAGAGAGEYYLLDASAADSVVERLYLEWDEVAEPLLAQVSVAGSDDLNHWQPLLEKYTVATLFHDGLRLQQDILELPADRHKYYRIHWPPGSKGISLRRVELALRPQHAALPGERQVVAPQGEPSRDGHYDFRLDGHFPISGVQLLMPQRNSVVRATLYSRPDENAPWQQRYQGLFYDLEQQGQRLRSEPVSLAPLSHPLWRLEVQQSGGGLGSGIPQLELEWHPQRLFFVARGEMPFTLAFGRQQTSGDAAPLDPLLRQINDEETQARLIKSASAGAWFELGGTARLRPIPPPLPWQKWLLWAVLLGGVVLLALMARSLYRQMSRDTSYL